MKTKTRVHTRRHVRRNHSFEYYDFASLPPNARDTLQRVINNNVLWGYILELHNLEEKRTRLKDNINTLLRRIGKAKK
jgi:hypothetical protein